MSARRLDDPSAAIDSYLTHGVFLAAVIWSFFAAAGRAPMGAVLVAILAGLRLHLHPLRFVRLHKVVMDRGRLRITPMFGMAREVELRSFEHDRCSPWPCTLVLSDGTRARFVARRDDGAHALFDLHPSDRARYERPSDARDSLVALTSRGPAPSAGRGTERRDDRA